MIVIGCVIGCGLIVHHIQMKSLFEKTSSTLFDLEHQNLEQILDEADSFKLEKKIFSLKKHYYIKVDDVIVGEVIGENFPIFGDTLKLVDTKGHLVKSEDQVKRLGPTNGKLFNVSINRLAEVKDSDGNITGYIGEEKLKDFWKLEHRQYFYDKEATKIGSAKPDFIVLSKDYKIMDNQGNIDYIVDGNIFSLASKSIITKQDESEIDEEEVIFYIIIENAISDSKISSSSSSSSSKK